MKKKIYIIGVMTVLAFTCFGCGKKDAANNDKVAEATTEITTETTEKVTEQSDKKKAEKTTEATTEKVSEDKKSEKSDKKKSDSKKSDKKSGATTQAAATQPANNSKDVVTTTTNSNSSTSNNTSANNTAQTTQTSSKPQTTECQHNWVHVDAVTGERGVKPAVIANWYCNDCQKYYISVWDDPCGAANGSDAYYVLEPAVWETYEVSPAYDYCSKCGVRK